jgi:hypothetical protein
MTNQPLSPALFLSGAAAVLGMKDGSAARDAAIMKLLKGEMHTRARAWDMALVQHAGFWSHFDHRNGRSTWPIPAPKQHADLAAFAERENVLSSERPEAGEIFLLWSPAKKLFVHTGIVLSVEPLPFDDQVEGEARRFECHTIEGEVTRTGCLHGTQLGRVRRVLMPGAGDRSIRWADVKMRPLAAEPPHKWPLDTGGSRRAA